MLLEVNNLNVYYGAIHALQGISFNVAEGEIVTLIGANGAGKSTTLRTISGLLRPRQGHVTYKSSDITLMPAEQIVRLGISHVPEGRKIFSPLTVRENLEMGAYTREDKNEISATMERVFKHFPRLRERINQLGGTLSGGEQQMLVIGRAMMAAPHLMMLDEPSLGLAPMVVEQIYGIIKKFNIDRKTSILLVEQNVRVALNTAHYGYVMENGRVVLDGSADYLKGREDVKEFYIGISASGAKKSYKEIKHYKRRKRWL